VATDKHNPLNVTEQAPEQPTTEAPAAESPEDQAQAEIMGELMEDLLPTPGKEAAPKEEKEPEAEAKPEVEAKADDVAVTPERVAEKPDEPAPTPEKRYRVQSGEHRGQDLTLAELEKLGVIEAALTTAGQHKHLQDEYDALKTQVPGPQVVPAPPETVEISAERIEATYQEEMTRVTERGYIEQDFREVYPRATSAMLMHRDILYDTRKRVAEIIDHLNGREANQAGKDAESTVYGLIDGLAKNGELYEPLKDAKVRGDFYNHIVELNPTMEKLTPEFVDRQYFAYNKDIFADLKATPTEDPKEKKARVKGEGGTARVKTPPAPPVRLRGGCEPATNHLIQLASGPPQSWRHTIHH